MTAKTRSARLVGIATSVVAAVCVTPTPLTGQWDDVPPSIQISPWYGESSIPVVPLTITVCDDNVGLEGGGYIELNGVNVSGNFSGWPSYGQMCATLSGTVQLQSGWNSFYAHFWDINNNIGAGWADYTHTPQQLVTPDGASTPARAPSTGGHVASFTVHNTGWGSGSFTIACAGATNVTCTGTSTGSVALGAAQQVTVEAYYAVGAVGTGQLTLSATQAGGTRR